MDARDETHRRCADCGNPTHIDEITHGICLYCLADEQAMGQRMCAEDEESLLVESTDMPTHSVPSIEKSLIDGIARLVSRERGQRADRDNQ